MSCTSIRRTARRRWQAPQRALPPGARPAPCGSPHLQRESTARERFREPPRSPWKEMRSSPLVGTRRLRRGQRSPFARQSRQTRGSHRPSRGPGPRVPSRIHCEPRAPPVRWRSARAASRRTTEPSRRSERAAHSRPWHRAPGHVARACESSATSRWHLLALHAGENIRRRCITHHDRDIECLTALRPRATAGYGPC